MGRTQWMTALLACGLAPGVSAQVATAEMLAGLQAQAAAYEGRLPSLECRERIVSQELKKGEVKREVVVEGAFRLKRQETGNEPFAETHQYETVNGKALAAGKRPNFPVLLDGGFANGPGLFFAEKRMHCFRFEERAGAPAQRELWVTLEDLPGDATCEELPRGITGKVWVDRASGQIDYVERNEPAEEAKARKQPEFASVTYAAIPMGGQTYWLPTRIEARPSQDNLRFVATYSDFKRYGASITVLPQVEKVPEP